MKVEAELVSQLYKINSKKLDDVDPEYLLVMGMEGLQMINYLKVIFLL